MCSGTVCETNLVNAVLTSFVDQLIHNVQRESTIFPIARMTHMHGYTSVSRFHSAKTMVCFLIPRRNTERVNG